MHDRPMMLVPNRIERGYPGGREIDKFRRLDNPHDDTRPEAWVGSTTYTYHYAKDPSSTQGLAEVYTGTNAKAYLKDIIEAEPVAYLGEKHVAAYGSNTGLLVKLLDAQRQLGLQAHPDRDFARRMFNSKYGKVESWYVIGTRADQKEEPYVLLGFKEGVTRERFQRLFLAGKIREMEESCHKIPVSVGEMYFVDAGVPHAIGPGCFVIEVQEPSDITVGARMRHFDNPADEQEFIEKAMGCYHYVGRRYQENLATCLVPSQTLSETEGGVETLLLGPEQTPFFSVTRLSVHKDMKARHTGTFSIAIILAGKGELVCETGRFAVKQGDELFLPAGIKNLLWKAEGTLQVVTCYPPGALDIASTMGVERPYSD